ncbi:hypothetical protein SDC9_168528 [bioreactor metagenome]|uniref:Uncharacterized protein n=1 Tax=bioreactor metagenome TaxID=1076179 RepID=A0A645G5S1_9ZZZZ
MGDHAAHVFFGLGLHPDGGAVRQQFIEGGRIGDDAAGRGDDHVGIDLHGFFQGAAFVAAVSAHAIQVINLAHAAARELFDFLVELDERHAHVIGQPMRQRGFARAAQADERDARMAVDVAAGRRAQQFASGNAHAVQFFFAAAFEQLADQQPFGAGGGDVAQQLGHGALQRLRDLVQHQNGDVAGAVFQIGKVALGYLGATGQAAPREAAPRAQLAHPLAQGLQQLVLVRCVGKAVVSLVTC